MVRIFVVLVISIIIILIYNGLDGTKAGVQNRNGALFFVCVNSGMSALANVGLVFPSERPVFLREVNNGMYRVSSYFWSKLFSEVPMSAFIPLLQGTLCFFGVGFDDSYWYKYPRFLLCFWLNYNAFAGTGYILGVAISKKEVINILTPVIIVPTMMFTGFFVNQENIPWFLTPF